MVLDRRFRKLYLVLGLLCGLGVWGPGAVNAQDGATFALETTQPEDAVISVTEGAQRDIPADLLGVNGNLTNLDAPWSDPALLEATDRLSLGTLRYPAGTLGNYWDWDIGWVAQEIPAERFFAPWVANVQASSNRYTLENLAEVVEAQDLTVVFMLNMTTRDLEHALSALRRAQDLGIPVERIELGNELWIGNDEIANEVFPTPADYVRAANEWAETIKAEWPDAKIAAVGSEVVPRIADQYEGRERRFDWNSEVLPLLSDDIDALTVHLYPRTVLGAKGGRWGSAEEQAAQYAAFNTEAGVAALLGQPQAYWDAVLALSDLESTTTPFWLTEWNLWDGTGTIHNSWAHGLVVASMINTFLSDERVDLIVFHNLINRFSAIHTPGDGNFAGLELEGIDAEALVASVEPYSLTAPGHVLAFFGEAATGMTGTTELAFEGAPVLTVNGLSYGDTDSVSYPALWGWTFSDEASGASSAVLANVSGAPLELDLSTLDVTGARYRQLYTTPQTYVTNAASLNDETGTAGETLVLPPYSLTLLEGE